VPPEVAEANAANLYSLCESFLLSILSTVDSCPVYALMHACMPVYHSVWLYGSVGKTHRRALSCSCVGLFGACSRTCSGLHRSGTPTTSRSLYTIPSSAASSSFASSAPPSSPPSLTEQSVRRPTFAHGLVCDHAIVCAPHSPARARTHAHTLQTRLQSRRRRVRWRWCPRCSRCSPTASPSRTKKGTSRCTLAHSHAEAKDSPRQQRGAAT
jgi:hypothetical protein